MTEKSIEMAILRLMKKHKTECPKLQALGRRGFPDRTALIPGGKPVFFEIKTPTGVLSPAQRRWIKILRELGYEVHVVRSASEVDRILEGRYVTTATKRPTAR